MVHYNSQVIYEFSQRLETNAQCAPGIGALVGAILGALPGVALGQSVANNPLGGLLVGAGVLGFIGLLIGIDRAFRIRLALHTMLCQVQIEENTRPLSTARELAPPPLALAQY